ncbi:uncharacterized protein LOC111691122 isoform X2 [Lucilia cuprina]|uniref:uncharacterized protein LOC111691122 isoform X2 n=1 Tax=Lucilia cuprina TaxID=7375 RepID=UPI001F06E8FF|nr:uncharacterized protein LOC111691122 isoform X2 [Lucilia cuprina]
MKLKILLIGSMIGVLGVITCIKAVPIEVIYTGDSCDCPKNLNYLVNVPPPPPSKEYKPAEYGYKLEVPMQAKAKVTYSFDFTVEEPKAPPPPAEDKLEIFAKIDRITAHNKDCLAAKEVPNTCGCNRCAKRYVSPENRATRYARNFQHPNSIDNIKPATSQIMAIFLEPLNESETGATKSRNKRDISRIFMRPRKNEKRSDRVVKQYNKRLKEPVSNKAFYAETRKPIRSRSIAAAVPARNRRPLQQLTSFLTLPRFRNRRDIKESTTTTTTTTSSTTSTSETTTMTSTESEDNKQETLGVTEPNNPAVEEEGEKEEGQEKDLDNSITSTHTKRNAADYGGGGCPLVFNGYNPTPNPGYTFEPLTSFEAIPRPFSTANDPYGFDPVPQQYVGAPHNPYAPAVLDNAPLVGAQYPTPNVQPISNAQLDQIIAEIINKHSDFIEASSHRGGAYMDPLGEQEQQAKDFFKNLMSGNWNGWLGDDQQHHSQHPVQTHHQTHYHAPVATHVHSPSSPPYYQ